MSFSKWYSKIKKNFWKIKKKIMIKTKKIYSSFKNERTNRIKYWEKNLIRFYIDIFYKQIKFLGNSISKIKILFKTIKMKLETKQKNK